MENKDKHEVVKVLAEQIKGLIALKNFIERDILKDAKSELSEGEISLCNGCGCMTKSIVKGRANFRCGKCGHDKTLGDVFQHEAKHDTKLEQSETDES